MLLLMSSCPCTQEEDIQPLTSPSCWWIGYPAHGQRTWNSSAVVKLQPTHLYVLDEFYKMCLSCCRTRTHWWHWHHQPSWSTSTRDDNTKVEYQHLHMSCNEKFLRRQGYQFVGQRTVSPWAHMVSGLLELGSQQAHFWVLSFASSMSATRLKRHRLEVCSAQWDEGMVWLWEKHNEAVGDEWGIRTSEKNYQIDRKLGWNTVPKSTI